MNEAEPARTPVATLGDLGRYRLVVELDRGGMGVVYLALLRGPQGFHKLFVVKELRSHLVDDPRTLQMFLEEARLAARMNHPNVVQTLEVGQEGTRPFMVMEYLEGHSLDRIDKRARAKKRVVPLHIQLRAMVGMLGGLHYAHELKDFDGKPLHLVHRDVSPHNVFLTYDGHVKVIDFGIAKAADTSNETSTGVVKGKVAYLAPEQARGVRELDRRVDVFAAGVMLWQVVAGRKLWEGATNEMMVLHGLVTNQIPRLRDARPDVPRELEAIVERAMAPDPANRYPTALAMQQDLARYVAEMGVSVHANDDLGAFVAELFAEERAKVRALVEQQVRRARELGDAPIAAGEVPRLSPSLGPGTNPGYSPGFLAPGTNPGTTPGYVSAQYAQYAPGTNPGYTPGLTPGASGSTGAAPYPMQVAPARSSPLAAILAIVIVVLIAGGAGAFFFLRTRARDAQLSPAAAPSASSSSGSCLDAEGFDGAGCGTCAPKTMRELESACTDASFEAFDLERIPVDPHKLPKLPKSEPPKPVDATNATPVDPMLPKCASLGDSIVYATGSTAATAFLGQIAAALAKTSPPLAVVYQPAGSCAGVDAILHATSHKLSGVATYWSASGKAQTCAIDDPIAADVGFSDVFATTCFDLPSGLDRTVADAFGPVQVMSFVAPKKSKERAIRAEAAYLIYGFGATKYAVSPWDDPSVIFQRTATSGTQNLIAAAIGVPAASWKGASNKSSSDLRDAILGVDDAHAGKAIGILSADQTDDLRDKLHVLAFADYEQPVAFYPDATPTSFDKKNVRDGHYPLWGPLHMFAHVDASGVPARAETQRLLGIVEGSDAIPGVDLVEVFAKAHLVPICAMRVTRATDGGELAPFKPAKSCGCAFEERATGVSPPEGCTTCSHASDCPKEAPNCNRFGGEASGYCEP